MPRIANETSVLLADLHARLSRVVEVARQDGHDRALDEIRNLVGGAGIPVRRGPGRPRGSKNKASAAVSAKTDKRKNSWSGLTPEQRLKRVNAIRKGKGLPPKTGL
jgi:hypothetical protein